MIRLHSLQECNYLKIQESNLLLFKYNLVDNKNDIEIKIQEQYSNKSNDTEFQNVYKVLIKEMSLNELLLFQGLFSCSSQSEVTKLIEEQPCPAVFYKSFLELDMSNMCTILSFDSRSIKVLLDEKNNQYFHKDFPIFYKIM